jgi:cell filamentation protein
MYMLGLENSARFPSLRATPFSPDLSILDRNINALHPFREGNGRAQREFIRELALQAGFEVSWDLVAQEEMLAASVASFHQGSSAAFAMILSKITRPVG